MKLTPVQATALATARVQYAAGDRIGAIHGYRVVTGADLATARRLVEGSNSEIREAPPSSPIADPRDAEIATLRARVAELERVLSGTAYARAWEAKAISEKNEREVALRACIRERETEHTLLVETLANTERVDVALRRQVAQRLGILDPGDTAPCWDEIVVGAVERGVQLGLDAAVERIQRCAWDGARQSLAWRAVAAEIHALDPAVIATRKAP